MKLLALLVLFLAACSSSTSTPVALAGVGTLPAPASAWPAAGFDARHSSGTTAVGPQHGTVKWRANIGGDVTPGPVIGTDGSILAASNSGVLYALDPSSGAVRWKFDGGGGYGSDLSTSPAVLTGGTILWPGPNDTLFALTAQGQLAWKQTFAGQVLSPAVAGANRVYVADLAGHLDALEVTPTSHRLVWTLDVKGTDYGSPTVGPDGTIYTVSNRDLVAVRDEGAKGVERWRNHTADQVEVSNAVAPNGTVILGTNNDREYGIRPDGSKAWSYPKKDFTYSSSVARPDGTAWFGDNAGHVTTLNSSTGALVREVQGGQPPSTASIWTMPLVDAHSDVYVATVTGQLYAFGPTGTPLFDLNLGAHSNSYPALGADGTLYLGTTAGFVVAVG